MTGIFPPRRQLVESDDPHPQQKQHRRILLRKKQQLATVSSDNDFDHGKDAGARFRGFSAISASTGSMTTAAAVPLRTTSADSTIRTTSKKGMPQLKNQSIERRAASSSTTATAITRRSTGSRSSTMPGYMIPSQKQVSESRMVRHIEDRTGQDLSSLKSVAARKKRSQVSGDAMYQSSTSVPDSLMQFAKELHQVSVCVSR